MCWIVCFNEHRFWKCLVFRVREFGIYKDVLLVNLQCWLMGWIASRHCRFKNAKQYLHQLFILCGIYVNAAGTLSTIVEVYSFTSWAPSLLERTMNKKPLWNIPSLHSSLPWNHWFCLSPLIALLLWWTTKHHWGIRQCRPAALWACTLCTLSFFSTFFFFFGYLFWLLLICRLKSCIRLRSSRLCCLWCYYMEYYYKDVLKLGSWLRVFLVKFSICTWSICTWSLS